MAEPIEDWELSAFIDGDLPSPRMAEIEDALERLPDLRQKLVDMVADHWALAALGQAELDAVGELPPHLAALAADLTAELEGQNTRKARRRTQFLSQAWFQAVGLAAGVAVGWAAASWAAAPHGNALAEFIDEAAEVYRANDVAPAFFREPSPLILDNVDTLFARRLAPPDLAEAGFALAGIDVAGTDSGVAPVFVYTDLDARRLSLVLSLDSRTLAAIGDGATPRVTTHDGLSVSYGQENGVAYAVVVAMPEPRARQVAGRVAEALRH
jgi:anti-sigma factor RsiW